MPAISGISARHSPFGAIAIEDCAVAAILAFCAMQGAIPFIAPNEALEKSNLPGSPLTYWGGILSQLAVYGTICIFLAADFRRVLQWFGKMRWTAVLAALVLASTVWSQFPLFTLRRSIPFVLAALFGLIFAIRYPVRRQLAILLTSMTALAVASIVLALFFPKIGLDVSVGHTGDWQGAFTSKNACGRIMVLATAAALSLPENSFRKAVSVTLFVCVTILSGSRGAWMIEAIVLTIYAFLRIAGRFESRSRLVMMAASIVAMAAIILFAATHVSQLAELMGRDATLSGRTQIWKQVWPFVRERPLLGWGYAGFWRGVQGESFRVAAAMRFLIFHAHNGFLEIWLELGAAGLFVFTLSYLRAWRKLWPRLCSGRVERVTWMLYVLALVAVYDLDENTLLIYNGLFWILYVAAVVDIELIAVEEELAASLSALIGTERAYPSARDRPGSLVA